MFHKSIFLSALVLIISCNLKVAAAATVRTTVSPGVTEAPEVRMMGSVLLKWYQPYSEFWNRKDFYSQSSQCVNIEPHMGTFSLAHPSRSCHLYAQSNCEGGSVSLEPGRNAIMDTPSNTIRSYVCFN